VGYQLFDIDAFLKAPQGRKRITTTHRDRDLLSAAQQLLRAKPPDKTILPPNSALTSNLSEGLNFFVTVGNSRNTYRYWYWWRYQNRLPVLPHISGFSVFL
jgi:hypothetical protein